MTVRKEVPEKYKRFIGKRVHHNCGDPYCDLNGTKMTVASGCVATVTTTTSRAGWAKLSREGDYDENSRK